MEQKLLILQMTFNVEKLENTTPIKKDRTFQDMQVHKVTDLKRLVFIQSL